MGVFLPHQRFFIHVENAFDVLVVN